MPKNKAKWEEVKHYNFENVFGFHYLDTAFKMIRKQISLESLSENQLTVWNFYTKFGRMPSRYYNQSGKLIVR